MTIEVNPFGKQRPVSAYDDFIGRREVVRQILSSILNGRSVSVIGMPKVGSSSLLSCLLLPEMAAEFEVAFSGHLPVYVNMHALPTATPEQLLDSILGALEKQAATATPAPDVGAERSMLQHVAAEFPDKVERFQALQKSGFSPLILIDELDYAVTNPHMDLSLFKLMLFLQENALANFITSSHRPYADVEERLRVRDKLDDDLGSRAISYLEITLLPFVREEAALFLNRLPRPLRLDRKLISMLLAISGGHPYLLQLACFHALEQQRRGDQIDLHALWQAFNDSAEPFFEVLWSTATREVKASLLKMDEGTLKSSGFPRKPELSGSHYSRYATFLSTGGGILLGTGATRKVFSYAFGHYVLRKRADSGPIGHDRYVLSELRDILGKRFNLEEFKTLCFELGVDYDNLGGETKEGKARALINAAAQEGFVRDLIEKGTKLRPNFQWPTPSSPQ